MVCRIIFYSTFIILVSACTREKKECITTTTDYVNTGVSIDYATNFDLLKTIQTCCKGCELVLLMFLL